MHCRRDRYQTDIGADVDEAAGAAEEVERENPDMRDPMVAPVDPIELGDSRRERTLLARQHDRKSVAALAFELDRLKHPVLIAVRLAEPGGWCRLGGGPGTKKG